METQLEQIRKEQKASWNKFSPGWKKWDALTMDFLKPMGEEIIRQLDLQKDDVVLDVATGTGEPGLTIAGKVPEGKVVMIDLAEDMLKIARENAVSRGLDNIETKVCDVSELPFPDNTFDAISCRFGYMFFPDLKVATRELARVLKPGGKIAIAVWNVPEKNFWVTAIMGTIKKHMDIQPPPPDAPGMFRTAKEDLVTGLFSEAGLKNVRQKEVVSKLNCKTADAYWEMMTEVGAPIVAALNEADDETHAKIKNEVFERVRQKYPEGDVRMDSSALVVYGEK